MTGLEKFLILDSGFKNTLNKGRKTGFQFEMILPFYRALPLSNIVDLSLKVDEENIANDSISFKLREKTYSIDQLPKLSSDDHWWGFSEKAVILIDKAGGMAPGEHKLEVYMKYRWPIGFPNEDGTLRRMHDDNHYEKILKMEE